MRAFDTVQLLLMPGHTACNMEVFCHEQPCRLTAGAFCLAGTAGKEASSAPSDVQEPHLGVSGTLPSLPVKVEVYHMGQYSYKGISEPTDVCQILPASLSERRTRHHEAPPVITNGKVTCVKKDDSFHFTAQVPLPSVFHLPLAAEPPLYINIVRSEFQSFSAVSHSGNPRVTRA